MKLLVLLSFLIVGCTSNKYQCYESNSANNFNLPEIPTTTVCVDEEKNQYFELIHFMGSYELARPNYGSQFNIQIENAYYLYDGNGFNGFDFKRPFDDINAAITQVERCGDIYLFRMNSKYRINGDRLLNVYSHEILNKK